MLFLIPLFHLEHSHSTAKFSISATKIKGEDGPERPEERDFRFATTVLCFPLRYNSPLLRGSS
jgi:hypothetical protein